MADAASRPRDRRRNRLRDEIAAVALDLFVENGYDNVTTEEIAAAADVAPRTFFRYFATKQATLWPAHEQQLAAFRDLLWSGAPSESVFSSIRRAMTTIARFYEDDYDVFIRRTTIMIESPNLWAYLRELQQPWADEVAEFSAQRLPNARDRLLPRLIGASSVAAQEVALKAWIQSGGRESYSELTEQMLLSLENLRSAVAVVKRH